VWLVSWLLGGLLSVFVLVVALVALLAVPVPARLKPDSLKQRGAVKRVRERLRARRRVLDAAAAVLAGAMVVGLVLLIVWALPSLLTRHPRIPAASPTGALDRHKAISDTRTGLVALTAVLGAGAGLAYTARTYRLSREGHITDRYTKAVEQLGQTEKLAVRLGGIYALERLAVDSDRDHHIVVEVLSAFVREHEPPKPGSSLATRILPDVQAVVTVLGRLPQRRGIWRRADLSRAHLERAALSRAHLEGADLSLAHLEGASLLGAHLEGASLRDAHLEGALLAGAHLEGADLSRAHLEGAHLEADLGEAIGLTQEQVDSGTVDIETRLPLGLVHPATWAGDSLHPPA
jgi:Pentapeptide repeats (8 copies)